MNVQLILVKIKERLNKLDSKDYSNIQCWQMVEAFNKAQIEWSRNQLYGNTQNREAGEQTIRRVDDLQVLLKEASLNGSNKDLYFESVPFPSDYLAFNRIAANASSGSCNSKRLQIDLIEEGNVSEWLNDWATKPSFSWGETFSTIQGNRIRVYHSKEFLVRDAVISYYRFPRNIAVQGCEDITGVPAPNDVDPEFKDDIVEMIVDLAVSHLAGDMESWNQFSRNRSNSEKND